MPLPFLIPAAVATATLTLRSDTKPMKVYVKTPRGTLYWGGAGLDGAYLKPTLDALQLAGIGHVNSGTTNSATRYTYGELGTLLDAARAGLVIRFRDDADWTIASGMSSSAEQFNLIGYSYGSLLAAQTANFYASCGHIVNHLVLIGSPIDGDFLTHLRGHPCIRKVVVIDLTEHGDDIYAGMNQYELMQPAFLLKISRDMLSKAGVGHFYYGNLVPDLPKRLNLLATRLHREGLR